MAKNIIFIPLNIHNDNDIETVWAQRAMWKQRVSSYRIQLVFHCEDHLYIMNIHKTICQSISCNNAPILLFVKISQCDIFIDLRLQTTLLYDILTDGKTTHTGMYERFYVHLMIECIVAKF